MSVLVEIFDPDSLKGWWLSCLLLWLWACQVWKVVMLWTLSLLSPVSHLRCVVLVSPLTSAGDVTDLQRQGHVWAGVGDIITWKNGHFSYYIPIWWWVLGKCLDRRETYNGQGGALYRLRTLYLGLDVSILNLVIALLLSSCISQYFSKHKSPLSCLPWKIYNLEVTCLWRLIVGIKGLN